MNLSPKSGAQPPATGVSSAAAFEAAAHRCLADGDLSGAAAHWGRALALAPEAADIRYNLARVLADLGRCGEAEAAYRILVRQVPDYVDALYNLGNLCMRRDAGPEAVKWYGSALAAAPEREDCRINLALALKAAGRPEQAEAVYREAIRRHPDSAEAHWNLAILLLSRGRWAEGFAEYQWRLRRFEAPAFPAQVPAWDGSFAPDRHLLLWAEQGIGDAIQFLRYVRRAAARTGRITVCCHRSLTGLAGGAKGVDRALAFGEPLSGVDIQAPLMSLPHLLADTDPADSWPGPYLRAPSAATPGTDRGRRPPRVGLVWSGNPEFVDNVRRCCPPDRLRPLVDRPGPVFYALQKGPEAEAAGRRALGDRVVDLAPNLDTFADTAEAVARLDLVVTVDTAVAHLAGAMGTKTWLLLHHRPDWRWQESGAATPWYPNFRLFRQETPGDWPTVVDAVCRELSLWENRRAVS